MFDVALVLALVMILLIRLRCRIEWVLFGSIVFGRRLSEPIHVIGMHALESNFESKFEFKFYEVLPSYVDLYEDLEVIPHSGTGTTHL